VLEFGFAAYSRFKTGRQLRLVTLWCRYYVRCLLSEVTKRDEEIMQVQLELALLLLPFIDEPKSVAELFVGGIDPSSQAS